MIKYCVIIFIFISVSLVFSQHKIAGGTINSDQVWNGEIIIEGDVTVSPRAKLTIDPGTRVLFSPQMDKQKGGKDKTRCELLVEGILLVKGTLDNKVTFTSASKTPQMGDWYGIRIQNPLQTSILDYCIIEYAFNGLNIKKSSPQVRNSQIRLNYNAGLLIEVKAEPKIIKNIISDNGYAGVISSLGSMPVFSENLISGNQIGVIVFSLSKPNLGYIGSSQKKNDGQNTIFDNTDYDVYNHSNQTIYAQNNNWGSDDLGTIKKKIYDKSDEARYGSVEFGPVFGQNNLDELLAITQATPTNRPQRNSSTTLATNTNRNPSKATQTAPVTKTRSSQDQTVQNDPKTDLTQTAQLLPKSIKNSNPDTAGESTDQNKTNPSAEEIQFASAINTTEKQSASPAPPPEIKEIAAPQIDYNSIQLEPFLDEKKVILHKEIPVITRRNIGFQTKGRIIVRAVVGKDGKVESATVIRGLDPYYNNLAEEAAKKFIYKTGTIKNIPVRFYTNILFDFN